MKNSWNRIIRSYSMWIASDGQTSTQVWQSTHMSLSIFALPSSMEIADAGHSLTQVSHPVHFSGSTTATNSFTPVIMFRGRQKKGFYYEQCPQGIVSGENPKDFRPRTRIAENIFQNAESEKKQYPGLISSARAHRSCHRCRAFYRQPSVQPAGHRLQRPIGHRPGG